MKILLACMSACAFLMACESADPFRSTTPGPVPTQPTGPTNPPSGRYVLSGVVRDENALPLAGAKAEILGGRNPYWWRSATTNESGVFRLEGVEGELWIQVGKAGYHNSTKTYLVNSNAQIDVRLVSGILPSAPISDTIQLGKTIRGVTNQPPCDATRWDARAPCRRYDFLSESPGHLDVKISYVGLMMDATFVTTFSDLYLDTSLEAGLGELTLSIDVSAFTYYEVRVNSYYEQQEFNLRAEFTPTGP